MELEVPKLQNKAQTTFFFFVCFTYVNSFLVVDKIASKSHHMEHTQQKASVTRLQTAILCSLWDAVPLRFLVFVYDTSPAQG